MAKFEMSKAFKEGALCDIFIPIEKFVLVLKAMREAGIFRPVCKVKSMSLLLFSKVLNCRIIFSLKMSIKMPKCQSSNDKTVASFRIVHQIGLQNSCLGPFTQKRIMRLAQFVLKLNILGKKYVHTHVVRFVW